jgi:hypothetical protein
VRHFSAWEAMEVGGLNVVEVFSGLYLLRW